jgi:hypothetical protein
MYLTVGQRFGDELVAGYRGDGLHIQMKFQSGKNFPSTPIIISWEEWERFVAWVELQRKEQALKDTKKT